TKWRCGGGSCGWARPLLELLECALGWLLVLSPAEELGAVADAAGAHVVEAHLDNELGPYGDPLEVAFVCPPAWIARAALAGLIWGELCAKLALLLGLEAGGVPDGPDLAAVVQPEDEGAHRSVLLAGAPADD